MKQYSILEKTIIIEEHRNTLILLASKKYPDKNGWCAWVDQNYNLGICYICDQTFESSSDDWIQHGFNHLKKYIVFT